MGNDSELFYARALMERVVPTTTPELPPEMVIQLIDAALPHLDNALATAKVMFKAQRILAVARKEYNDSKRIGMSAAGREAALPPMTTHTVTHQLPDSGSIETTCVSHGSAAPSRLLGNKKELEADLWTTVSVRHPKTQPVLSVPGPRQPLSTSARHAATPGRDSAGTKVEGKNGSQARKQSWPAPPGFMRGVVIYNQQENILSPSEGTRGNATTAGKGKGSWEIVARKKSCRVQGLD
ncbi:hypothetical protein K466DRAFT_585868 [Polyporus arcularius HHB13444]|uniref:Uncharacterized protein n=1 Tax=Polyporus arcularius HHB13444 TaxID=1314778 RepID=A0A5C3PI97_9APHY|nr:hypothetical protein K466DRAFT_585868 [Polyporus arcularius HHB13444]